MRPEEREAVERVRAELSWHHRTGHGLVAYPEDGRADRFARDLHTLLTVVKEGPDHGYWNDDHVAGFVVGALSAAVVTFVFSVWML